MDKNVIKRLCDNIVNGKFNWRKYCDSQTYFGKLICVQPLFSSYGQIGFIVYFPYQSDMPEITFDWELGKLTLDNKTIENE